ncbi:hypothetical protein BLNAU_2436 [Blattamonas nauphoetae]|uniref:GED domain-containing protein n=1 Tax=Blattamonas nauphoetae TaxID=2049346 RepID=A0ABQ9YFX7_9EUKA|nr:hypothetical protein BLNAU_2436 [Blattamonas nauphoetae]
MDSSFSPIFHHVNLLSSLGFLSVQKPRFYVIGGKSDNVQSSLAILTHTLTAILQNDPSSHIPSPTPPSDQSLSSTPLPSPTHCPPTEIFHTATTPLRQGVSNDDQSFFPLFIEQLTIEDSPRLTLQPFLGSSNAILLCILSSDRSVSDDPYFQVLQGCKSKLKSTLFVVPILSPKPMIRELLIFVDKVAPSLSLNWCCYFNPTISSTPSPNGSINSENSSSTPISQSDSSPSLSPTPSPISPAQEYRFFRSFPILDANSSHCSIPSMLVQTLRLLEAQIIYANPTALSDLSSLLHSVRTEAAILGIDQPQPSAYSVLLDTASNFAQLFLGQFQGTRAHSSALEQNKATRRDVDPIPSLLSHLISDLPKQLTTQFEEITDDQIFSSLCSSPLAAPLFVPHDAFYGLVKLFISKMRAPCQLSVEQSYQSCLDAMGACTSQVRLSRQFPQLVKAIEREMAGVLSERRAESVDRVDELIEVEMAFVNIHHPDFNLSAIVDSVISSQRKSHSSEGNTGKNGQKEVDPFFALALPLQNDTREMIVELMRQLVHSYLVLVTKKLSDIVTRTILNQFCFSISQTLTTTLLTRVMASLSGRSPSEGEERLNTLLVENGDVKQKRVQLRAQLDRLVLSEASLKEIYSEFWEEEFKPPTKPKASLKKKAVVANSPEMIPMGRQSSKIGSKDSLHFPATHIHAGAGISNQSNSQTECHIPRRRSYEYLIPSSVEARQKIARPMTPPRRPPPPIHGVKPPIPERPPPLTKA